MIPISFFPELEQIPINIFGGQDVWSKRLKIVPSSQKGRSGRLVITRLIL